MKPLILAVPLLLLLSVVAPAQNLSALRTINKIYVGEIGSGENSDLIREKLKIRILKSKRFSLVENEDQADAILTGIASTSHGQVGSIATNTTTGDVSGSMRTVYSGMGALWLIDLRSKEPVWAYEYKPGDKTSAANSAVAVVFPIAGIFRRSGSASSSVADKAMKRLLKDAKAADKGKTK